MPYEFRREYRRLSPADKERYSRLAAQVEKELPPGSARPPRRSRTVATIGEYFDLRAVAADLRDARRERNLSLSQIEQATGIAMEELQRFEDGAELNPSLGTLSRYACAVGKTLQISVADAPVPSPLSAS